MSPKQAAARDKKGKYPCPEGDRHTSVTTFNKCINKPFLLPWACKLERETTIAAAVEAFGLAIERGLKSKADFKKQVEALVATELAGERVKRRSGDIGSAIHAILEWHVDGMMGRVQGPAPTRPPEIDARAWVGAGLAASIALSVLKSLKAEPILNEETIICHDEDLGGTLDLYAKINFPGEGRIRSVLDYKSSSGIYPDAVFQIAAYGFGLIKIGLHPPEEPLGGVIIQVPKTGKGRSATAFITPANMKIGWQKFRHVQGAYNGLRWAEELLSREETNRRLVA